MNDSPRFPLRFLPALLFVLLLAGTAGAALTVVRLREEESRLAKSAIQYQNQISETSRRSHEAAAAVAQALQPDALRVRVNGRLQRMLDKQIVWVRPSALSRPQPAAPASALSFTNRFAVDKPATLTLLSE